MLQRFKVDSQADWEAGAGVRIDTATSPGSIQLEKFADAIFSRPSTRYDDQGNAYAEDVPWYLPGGGILPEEGTENLFPADKALVFDAPWYAALDGTYTVSVGAGAGRLVLSGGATGSIGPGESLTFVASDAVVFFTPEGAPEQCQLEEKEYATSWHEGC